MKKFTAMLSILALSVVMVACGPSFDKAKVKQGMTEAELVAACGEADGYFEAGSKKTMNYGDEKVTLIDGKVDLGAGDMTLDGALEGLGDLLEGAEDLGNMIEGLGE